MSIDWELERPLITAEALKHNVDPDFIRTIRHVENGGAGREFGVLSTSAPTYPDQLHVAVITVAHRLELFPKNPLIRDHNGRIKYSPNWIAYFANIWAPGGVDNDPDNLNKNWYKNALEFYG